VGPLAALQASSAAFAGVYQVLHVPEPHQRDVIFRFIDGYRIHLAPKHRSVARGGCGGRACTTGRCGAPTMVVSAAIVVAGAAVVFAGATVVVAAATIVVAGAAVSSRLPEWP